VRGRAAARMIMLEHLRRGEREMRVVRALLGHSGLFIDVGANFGVYSVLVDMLGRQVIAFEPHPCVAKELRKSLADAHSVYEVCLSSTIGEAMFHVPVNVSGEDISTRGSMMEPVGPDVERRRIRVRMEKLDSYQLVDVALIKIDVEGHEWQVLLGARETIERERPCVLIEVEQRHAPGNLIRVAEFFRSREYEGWFLRGRKVVPVGLFDPSADQAEFEAPDYGRERSPQYINNFIWIPHEEANRVLPAMRHAACLPVGVEVGRIGIRYAAVSATRGLHDLGGAFGRLRRRATQRM
jgi:FkbM family methyltransferase